MSLRRYRMPRSAARAQATYGRMLNQLRTDADLETPERAATAVEIVLGSIVRRLTPNEAKDLISQLPSLLQPTLRALPPGPDKSITRQAIEGELLERLGAEQAHAWQILAVVSDIVAQSVSPGQIQDMHGQLPDGLREMFSDYPTANGVQECQN